MVMKTSYTYALAGAAAAVCLGWFTLSEIFAQGGLQTPPVAITVLEDIPVPQADAQSLAITDAALAFLATLSDEQRAAAVFDFADNTQRANWSNFPDGPVVRKGVMRGDMTDTQLAALEGLLKTVMSDEGYRNIALQLAAEDALGNGFGGPNFGSPYYYVSFLGTPAADTPWMLQFGGHHLAINVTVVGPDLSFSPLLTGGEPLRINFEDQDVYITEAETAAAQAFMDSLDAAQKQQAIRGSRPINLVLGPGAFDTQVAPEGIRGGDLDAGQRQLLLDVIAARLGFINADDFAAKMAVVDAELDDTYFGWWGPEGTLGAAYFRVTGPSVVLEYAPQDQDGDNTDHAHNMYRDPQNDYGVAWIAAK